MAGDGNMWLGTESVAANFSGVLDAFNSYTGNSPAAAQYAVNGLESSSPTTPGMGQNLAKSTLTGP